MYVSISDLKSIFVPKEVALSVISGCIAGRFCRISPLHGAIYAVGSRIVSIATFAIGVSIAYDLENNSRSLNLGSYVFALLPTMSAFLAFAAGNKALSLIGKPLIFSTAVKVRLISEIIVLSSCLLMDRMRN